MTKHRPCSLKMHFDRLCSSSDNQLRHMLTHSLYSFDAFFVPLMLLLLLSCFFITWHNILLKMGGHDGSETS